MKIREINNVSFFLILSFLIFFASNTKAQVEQTSRINPRQNYPSREIVVQFKKELLNLGEENSFKSAQKKFNSLKGSLTRKDESSNLVVYELAEDIFQNKSVEDAQAILKNEIDKIKKLPVVQFAEPNYQRQPLLIKTNDLLKDKLWGLDNNGQTVSGIAGEVDADIDAPEAWAVSNGVKDIVVAVIDTGIDYNHPDFSHNLWEGTDCADKNGNYLGGCIHGYDFQDDDKDPMLAGNEHGTLVSGIIGATPNNGIGVLGVAPKAKIMALKSNLSLYELVAAVDFAIANNVKIINASYGGDTFSEIEYQSIKKFKDSGGIMFAGAGNVGSNNEVSHFYPSDYDLDNIISVAATNQFDQLASFSNYGKYSVDIAAPGENILTTSGQNNSFVYASGTSMSTPYVSGLAALLWSYKPNLNAQQVRQLILESGDSLPALAGKIATSKRINAYKTLTNPIVQTKALYRFYSQNHQAHFYTISQEERDHIIATYPVEEWNYEGIAYYSFP